jgi:predicted lipoprotein with Yx(FWY)xxD motif
MPTRKRLPLYLAGGAAVSALAVTGGLIASAQSGAAKPATGPSAAAATTVQTRTTGLGPILVDGQGRTLYLFAKDTGDQPSCTGTCAGYWPPVPANGAVHAGGGASATDLGMIAESGGGEQLSYAGHPLYYFVGDHKAGDTTGQALNQFGGLWYALTPTGTAVTQSASNTGGGTSGFGY